MATKDLSNSTKLHKTCFTSRYADLWRSYGSGVHRRKKNGNETKEVKRNGKMASSLEVPLEVRARRKKNKAKDSSSFQNGRLLRKSFNSLLTRRLWAHRLWKKIRIAFKY